MPLDQPLKTPKLLSLCLLLQMGHNSMQIANFTQQKERPTAALTNLDSSLYLSLYPSLSLALFRSGARKRSASGAKSCSISVTIGLNQSIKAKASAPLSLPAIHSLSLFGKIARQTNAPLSLSPPSAPSLQPSLPPFPLYLSLAATAEAAGPSALSRARIGAKQNSHDKG